MYLDALSFLEDERDALRPYERLLELSDAQLDVEVAGAHGWSGRDLLGHLVLAQEAALAVAKELAVGPKSAEMERQEALWSASPEAGDAVNQAGIERFRAMPIADVREAFRDTAGELRGYLTVVPEARWIKDSAHQEYFFGEMTEHYEEHLTDLQAILEAAASA